MRTDDFWAVVDRAAADRPAADVARRVVAELAVGDPDSVVGWGRHLDRVLAASCTEDLWAAAYLINGGCSDDDFESFRGWLVAQGREVLARAVREPDSLATLPAVRGAAEDGAELRAPEVLRIAADAHELATGVPLPPRARLPRPDPAQFWDFDDEDEMRRRLPRLSALFLEPPP
jgi:Protein of unknown function (DUF4240)